MQIQEFVNLAGEVVERLSPKIDPQQGEFVREDAEAGAWENALTNLVASLAERDVIITRQDRDDLRRLLADLGESTENVDRLHAEHAYGHRSEAGTRTPPSRV